MATHESTESGSPSALAVFEAPPERVGLLLAETRVHRGLSLHDVADDLGHDVTAAEVLAVEGGMAPFETSLFMDLARLYDIEPEDLVPPRDRLVVDLAEGFLRIGPDLVLLSDGVGNREVLNHYLEMVWELREVEPGTSIPLRDEDVAVLSGSLDLEPVEIERSLLQRMTGVVGELAVPRARVIIGFGVAVALLGGGAALLMHDSRQPDVGQPVAAVQMVDHESVQPVAPLAQVGDAVVLERNADGTPGEQHVR